MEIGRSDLEHHILPAWRPARALCPVRAVMRTHGRRLFRAHVFVLGTVRGRAKTPRRAASLPPRSLFTDRTGCPGLVSCTRRRASSGVLVSPPPRCPFLDWFFFVHSQKSIFFSWRCVGGAGPTSPGRRRRQKQIHPRAGTGAVHGGHVPGHDPLRRG